MKGVNNILVWTVSWLLSAHLLIPLNILSILTNTDLHHKFHVFWYKIFIIKHLK